MGEWDDPDLIEEYCASYNTSKNRLLKTPAGKATTEKAETHCFYGEDATKYLVSRLPHSRSERINELRLRRDGQMVRASYLREEGPEQNLDDLFRSGLLGLENNQDRFARYPGYVLEVKLLIPEGNRLSSVYRGIGYFDDEDEIIVFDEEFEGRSLELDHGIR